MCNKVTGQAGPAQSCNQAQGAQPHVPVPQQLASVSGRPLGLAVDGGGLSYVGLDSAACISQQKKANLHLLPNLAL